MPSIFLNAGEPNPNNIRLRDPFLTITGTADIAFAVSAITADGSAFILGDAAAVPARTRLMAWGGPGAALYDGFLAGIVLPVSSIDATGSTAVGTTGTGDVTFAVAALDATGLEIFTGSASIAPPVSALAATALEVFSGAASVVPPASAIAATGLEVFTGSATIAPTVSALDAAALEIFTGAAAVTFPVSAIDAVGAQGTIFAGAASLDAPVSTISATGSEVFTGTAAVATASDIAASGLVVIAITGTGDVALPVSAIDGIGNNGAVVVVGAGGGSIWLKSHMPRLRPEPAVLPKRTISGRGAISVEVAQIEGEGVVTFVGRGAARHRVSASRAEGKVVLKGRADLRSRISQSRGVGEVVLRDDTFGLDLEELDLELV